MRDSASADFWEDHYTAEPAPAQPRPNVRLTELVTTMPAGVALDLGCGNGGDAFWLASRGWSVTAVDISASAVEQLDNLAHTHGLNDQISAARYDLQKSFPPGAFHLVNVHYLHTPFRLDKVRVLRSAARALLPGGHLLVVDHGSTAPWSWNQDPAAIYPHPLEIHAEMNVDPIVWTVERAEAAIRIATGPDGQTAQVTDHVLLIRRANN